MCLEGLIFSLHNRTQYTVFSQQRAWITGKHIGVVFVRSVQGVHGTIDSPGSHTHSPAHGVVRNPQRVTLGHIGPLGLRLGHLTKLLLLLVAVVDMAIGLWVDGVAVTGGGVGG